MCNNAYDDATDVKFVDSPKTQTRKYLESKKIFFLRMKINHNVLMVVI